MRTILVGASRLAFLPLALLALGASCGTEPALDCTSGPICETKATGERYVVPRCVPAWNDGSVPADCGIFVSASLGDDKNPGTQDKPIRTLARAAALAGAALPIYACAEDFYEHVLLPAGASLFGGLDCKDGFRWKSDHDKTRLHGAPDEVPLVLGPGVLTSRIEDLAVFAADAELPGGSSIALVADHARAELMRCDVRAGAGGDGEDGVSLFYDPTKDGLDGMPGASSCSTDPAIGTPGGARIERVCEGGIATVGGKGGDGGAITAGSLQSTPGKAGEVGAPTAPSFGLGGAGDAGDAWSCVMGTGTPGYQGAKGTPGAGAAGFGRLDVSGYVGVAGGPGTLGFPGQGGGGAGGARGGASICAGGPGSGASGGSGGTGGCGGMGGMGGGAGGASVAIASIESSLVLWHGRVAADRGGRGGRGGDGQPGGSGGVGGKGGKGGAAPDACQGGAGGKGGTGGPGGGGLGGPAIVIAHIGAEPELRGAVSLATGKPGDGGLGGDGDVAGNRGAPGIGAAIRSF